ncbi:MAG: 3-dehydroquinate synthase [Bacteroidia bacterium]
MALNLPVQSSGYSIYIGSGALSDLDKLIRNQFSLSKIVVLVDEHTALNCLPTLMTQIPLLEKAHVLEIESGEASKNIEVCIRLWRAIGELGGDRHSLLINLGGGVIGDMGGFVASTYKRGIPFIQVPTTLLSQVDASVGGKTGIDLDHLKNEIGVFSVPQGVFIWPDFLKTLSRREMVSGFAEMIKHALIADRSYWDELLTVNMADASVWEKLIYKSVYLKNEIVKGDPLEKGIRKALNFGHTIGHAIESYFLEIGEKKLLHGEAVAVGMITEAYISARQNGLSMPDLESITRFIKSNYSPVILEPLADHRLLELMRHDKKNENGKLNFTLLNHIGECSINKNAEAGMVRESLNYYRSINQAG